LTATKDRMGFWTYFGYNGVRNKIVETNANGVRHDMLYKNISELQRDWTVIWETQSAIDEQGWSFEMAIPFKSLPFNPSIDTWGFNFARGIRRRGEEVVWCDRTYNPNIVGHARVWGMDQASVSTSCRRYQPTNAMSRC
jgi:hypothetical protein